MLTLCQATNLAKTEMVFNHIFSYILPQNMLTTNNKLTGTSLTNSRYSYSKRAIAK